MELNQSDMILNQDHGNYRDKNKMNTKLQNVPNWKKGDVIALINYDGGAISIFEAEHNPQYCATIFTSEKDWHYGLRNCKEIRLATKDDIDKAIQFQKEITEQEHLRLDQLFNFRERLSNE